MDQLTTLRPYLLRFGRRLRVRDGWLFAQRSLWVACAAAVMVQVTGRIWPIEPLLLWTVIPLVAWSLVVASALLLRPGLLSRVARRCDAELGLKERLATAIALAEWQSGRAGGRGGGAFRSIS